MTQRVAKQLESQRHVLAEREGHAAQDGRATRGSWETLGARVLRAATLAATVHMSERARQTAEPARRELQAMLDAAMGIAG